MDVVHEAFVPSQSFAARALFEQENAFVDRHA